ncbi:hypothetical protein [Paraflavitalea pollutisoli]|uniref:hypothetical protein n=1 Tax=Paraflavitalea pollutisoli TaxID=3034143 RepID=UPI0023ECB413|nr:hypothetical protein [Paraflavitalea sp. H1-2-19X]
MKKLTPILTLFHTANFLEEGNNAGNVIDYTSGRHFVLEPVADLAERMSQLGGYIDQTDHYTRLLVSYEFNGGAPLTPLAKLPAVLSFYLTAPHMEKIRPSGLPFNNRLLVVKPLLPAVNYVFRKKTVACLPCGAAAELAAGDLLPYIPTNVTVAGIRSLMQQPLEKGTKTLDVKVTIAGNAYPLVKDEDLKAIHNALYEQRFKTIALSFNRQSDNSALASFPKIVVTDGAMPVNTLGVVNIPQGNLAVTETEAGKYSEINNFIVHFPSFQTTINLTLNVPTYDAGSKLMLDGVEIVGAVAVPHPQMPNYKRVTGTVNNYRVYLYKSKLVSIENGSKKKYTPIDPMNNYNAATNTSTITINK